MERTTRLRLALQPPQKIHRNAICGDEANVCILPLFPTGSRHPNTFFFFFLQCYFQAIGHHEIPSVRFVGGECGRGNSTKVLFDH